MAHAFAPGYARSPSRVCAKTIRTRPSIRQTTFVWSGGPIFHRGRLDGSARILVIGQDPAQHETIVRRILVGEAGRRVQGSWRSLASLRVMCSASTAASRPRRARIQPSSNIAISEWTPYWLDDRSKPCSHSGKQRTRPGSSGARRRSAGQRRSLMRR